MSTGNERFNAEAAAWDSNPDVHRASDSALQAILGVYTRMTEQKQAGTVETEGYDVLEIGCGTGLLSLRIAPYVRSLLAVDAAAGMIDALKMKLAGRMTDAAAAPPTNITPLCIMLEDPEDAALPEASDGSGARKKFDLVLSHLVLHHIPELKPLLQTMLGCLKPGGWVCLTDYQDFGPEARKFHPEAKMAGVERHGIDAQWFAGLMEEVGFENVVVSIPWTMDKEVESEPGDWGGVEGKGEFKKPKDGCQTMGFPFLLCRGRRSARPKAS